MDLSILSSTVLDDDRDFMVLRRALKDNGISEAEHSRLVHKLKDFGFQNSNELISISRDYYKDSDTKGLHKLLHVDFQLPLIDAHRVRVALSTLLGNDDDDDDEQKEQMEEASSLVPAPASAPSSSSFSLGSTFVLGNDDTKRVLFKEFHVNEKKKNSQSHNTNYALRESDFGTVLKTEMAGFYLYMTEPSTDSQEAPIRKTTADVYYRHARLFIGWYAKYIHSQERKDNADASDVNLQMIFRTKEKEGASVIYEFIKFLRTERDISDSYEANIIRGLSKLAKYRFAKESESDPSYGEKSYEDIAVIRECRKLHRDANRRSKLSPRVSNEDKKWLSWPEYLGVIGKLKHTLQIETHVLVEMMQEGGITASPINLIGDVYKEDIVMDAMLAADAAHLCQDITSSSLSQLSKKKILSQQRRIAYLYQKYLILSFFASVPDRQRTIRELCIGKTLLKQSEVYVIKHGPDDYKTGKSYGDRPPLEISRTLTQPIDTFITYWRPFHAPQANNLFLGVRTGKALSADAIYSTVARTCYEYSGKKTNPHLLRDMIVTHVRDTQASERELEALALFMGHSINMQRSSYDRRSLKQKVSPAVSLLQSLSASVP
jgi:hypothetical protein